MTGWYSSTDEGLKVTGKRPFCWPSWSFASTSICHLLHPDIHYTITTCT